MKFFELSGRVLRHPEPDSSAGAADAGAGAAGTAEPEGGAVLDAGSWIQALPEEARKDPAVTKYKTADDFYKGYKSTVELVGRKGVIVPKDDAPAEEKDKFYNSLGRPEKPDGYKLTDIKDLHPSIAQGITPESKNAFFGVAHKLGLTGSQADGLNQWYLGALNQMEANRERGEKDAILATETAMRKEWGDKFDVHKANAVKLAMSGGEELMNALGGEKGLGNNPTVLKFLAKVASKLSEDQINGLGVGGSAPSSGSETKEAAQQKIDVMNKDQKHALWNQGDPKHDEAVKERDRLYKIAYGGES